MKVRFGFVSNSSSSSFVIMTTKENHEKAKKEIGSSRTNHLSVGVPDGGICRWTAGSGTAVRSWIRGG